MVIGKPLYVQNMVGEGLDKYQIAERFRTEINGLYYDYVEKNKATAFFRSFNKHKIYFCYNKRFEGIYESISLFFSVITPQRY